MPYNLELEERLDRLSPPLGKFTKRKMFGGVGYLMNGNMVFGIHKQSLVVRVSQARSAELLKQEHFSLFNTTGRPMMGWLLVSPEGLGTDEQLRGLLDLAFAHVKSLPGK